MAVVAELGGQGGLEAIQKDFVAKCGPKPDGSRTLAVAAAEAKKVVKSEVCAMMPEGLQLQFKSMHECLDALLRKATPKKPSAFSTWQHGLWMSLPNFYKSAGPASTDAGVKVGIAAFAADIAMLEGQSKKNVQILEGLEIWLPFMSAEMEASLDAIRKASTSGAKKRKLLSASAPETKSTGTKSQPTATESAEQAVMAMLRRRSG
eukprot:470909-Amphidinium_carterae.1